MDYSQQLETLINTLAIQGNNEQLRAQIYAQANAEGVDHDEIDLIIEARTAKAKKAGLTIPVSEPPPSMQSVQQPQAAPAPPPPVQNVQQPQAAPAPPPPVQNVQQPQATPAPPPPVQNVQQPQAAPAPPPPVQNVQQPQAAPAPPPPVQNAQQPQADPAPSTNVGIEYIKKNPLVIVIVAIGLAISMYFVFFNNHRNSAQPIIDEQTEEKSEVTDTVVVVKKETVYDNNESLKDELKSKMMSIWAEGVQGGNSLFMFKKYCSKDFCNTYDKYEKFLNGDFGSLDYDVWTQSQDIDGFKYKVKDILATGEKNVTVIMSLTNFGQTTDLKVLLIKENDKWVIDDFVNAQHSCKQLMREDMNQ